jgi:uncharacterized protein
MRKCPTCGKPIEWQNNIWRPFCSERCKLIDFGRWTSEEYRVPGQSINPAEIQPPKRERDSDDDEAEG